MSVLSVSAGLFFMFTFGLYGLPYGLSVSNSGFGQFCINTEFALHFGQYNIQVLFAQTFDKLL